MARIFAITVTDDVLKLDAGGQGAAAFTVTNTTARPLRGVLRLRPLDATEKTWLSVAGEPERDFSANGTQQVTVKVAVPAGTTAGKYGFRLDVLSATNPDEDYTEGPTVALQVKASPTPPPPRFPWWIAAVVALVVLAGGGAALYFLLPRTVAVPNVVGSPEAAAEKALADAGLASRKTTEVAAGVAPGTVKDQNPKAGEKVKPGATVALVVAAPPEPPPPPTKIPVPQVKGSRLLPALQALQQVRLNTISVTQLRTTDPNLLDKVLFVSPEVGTLVEPGTPITLTVGVTVPRRWDLFLTPAEKASPILRHPGVILKSPN